VNRRLSEKNGVDVAPWPREKEARSSESDARGSRWQKSRD
jgi:hypothetical protein